MAGMLPLEDMAGIGMLGDDCRQRALDAGERTPVRRQRGEVGTDDLRGRRQWRHAHASAPLRPALPGTGVDGARRTGARGLRVGLRRVTGACERPGSRSAGASRGSAGISLGSAGISLRSAGISLGFGGTSLGSAGIGLAPGGASTSATVCVGADVGLGVSLGAWRGIPIPRRDDAHRVTHANSDYRELLKHYHNLIRRPFYVQCFQNRHTKQSPR
jgi:hypothetical protein